MHSESNGRRPEPEQPKSPEELYELAYKDTLTGLWNRNGLDMMVEKILTKNQSEGEHNPERRTSAETEQEISIMILDIDHFKSFNDQFGHDVGDAVLAEVGKALKDKLKRDTDIVARWGGEELVVVFEGHDEQKVLDLFSAQSEKEKVEGIIGRPRFNVNVDVEGHHLKITLSGAVTTFKPSNESYEETFKRYKEAFKLTDETLYKAKGKGQPEGQGRDRLLGTTQQKEKDKRDLII